MSNPIKTVEGQSKIVELYEDRLRIARKGILARLFGFFSKEIPLDEINDIQIQEPGKLTSGRIRFGQEGYEESRSAVNLGLGKNEVDFRNNRTEFETLKDEIEDMAGLK